jgi:hypothetical protein
LSSLHRGTFANNDINFTDGTGVEHDSFGPALKKALYNYMHGIGLDLDVHKWFEERAAPRSAGRRARRRAADAVPRTTVPPNLIERALA